MYAPSGIINNFVFLEAILYSTFFPKESILFTKEAICNTSSTVIDIFYLNKTATTNHLVRLLYSECATPVLVNTLDKHIPNPEKETKLSTKVMLINSLDQVDTFMNVVYEFRFRKDKRKYFVIIEWIGDANQDQWLYYLFAKFWRKQVLNVVVIFHKHTVQIYTYQLLADRSSLNANVSIPTAMQEQNFNLNVVNITHLPTGKFFFNKLTNLQERKLVVSMFPLISRANLKKDGRSYTGVDGHVAELIRSRMNATFSYISPKMFFNGSINTGVIADLVEKKAHFAFNVRAYAPYNFNDTVEQTNAFDHIKFCVIVPRSGIQPVYLNIFHSLTPVMWILVIVSVIVVTVALAVVQYIHKTMGSVPQNHTKYTIGQFTAMALQSFFGDAIERLTLNLSIRCVLLGWLIYSFFITNAFTATIISSLIKPNYLENINTIEELGASDLTILYPTTIAKNLKNGFDNETWNLIGDNLKEIESWEKFVEIMNRNKTQYAYVLADYYALYVLNNNVDAKTGESIFHMVPECLASHPKVYLLQRGSMYLGYINELLGRFHEFGMFRRWMAETKFYSLLKGFEKGNRAGKPTNYSLVKVVITMEYLQTPFYMLGFGLIVSAITFCGEKLRYKLKREPRQKHRRSGSGEGFEEIEFEIK